MIKITLIPLTGARHKVSYIWYSGLGAGTVIVVGLLASLVFTRDVETLDRRLLSPCLETIYKVRSK